MLDRPRPSLSPGGALAYSGRELQICEIEGLAVMRVQTLRARGLSTPAADPRKLPHVPNTTTGNDPVALWRAPDDWLLYSQALTTADLDKWVSAVSADAPLVTTDISSASIAFELSGTRVIDVLLRDCTLDLEGDAVPPGGCAQTVFAQTNILIHRPIEPQTWRLFVTRPLARHVWEWLVDTAGGENSC